MVLPSLLVRYHQVLAQLQHYAQQAQRTTAIKLLVVSKQQSSESIRQLFFKGQQAFGENYLQEAITKIKALADLNIEWHFIGRIQSNKTKLIAENFSWAHSIDRLSIAKRLHDQRPDFLPPLSICIEVNASHDKQKGGVSLEELPYFIQQMTQFSRLRWRGLMTMITADYPTVGNYFHLLQQHYPIDTLSMGMSQDMEFAIIHGATLVRVGTAIFGERGK